MGRQKSRAKRLAQVASELSDYAAQLAEAEDLEAANQIISMVDVNEVESLLEEIESWRDNIEEKFSSTQKYSDLEECASALEEVKSAIETCQHPLSGFDERDDRVSELEEASSECDNVNFPGMFG